MMSRPPSTTRSGQAICPATWRRSAWVANPRPAQQCGGAGVELLVTGVGSRDDDREGRAVLRAGRAPQAAGERWALQTFGRRIQVRQGAADRIVSLGCGPGGRGAVGVREQDR